VSGNRHRVFDSAAETITIKPGASPIMRRAEF